MYFLDVLFLAFLKVYLVTYLLYHLILSLVVSLSSDLPSLSLDFVFSGEFPKSCNTGEFRAVNSRKFSKYHVIVNGNMHSVSVG